jgi:hypothetical protein
MCVVLFLQAGLAPLPPGWRRKWDEAQQKYYYIDDNTQTTHWELPASVALAGDLQSTQCKTTDQIDQIEKADTGTAWGFAHSAMGYAGKATAQGLDWTSRQWRENDGNGKVAAAQASLAKAYEDNTGRKTEDDVFKAKVATGAVGAAVAVSVVSTAATVAVAGGATYMGVKYHAEQNDWEGRYKKTQEDAAASYGEYLGRDPGADYKAAEEAAAAATRGVNSLGTAFVSSYREAKQPELPAEGAPAMTFPALGR